jgi:GNAT superfamily N-acetyltransferase
MEQPRRPAVRVSFDRVGPSHRDAVALAARATEEGDRVYADKGLPPAPSLEHLLQSGGRVLVGYVSGDPVACGAVRFLEPKTAEIKRMFVASGWRGRGIGQLLLAALEDEAADAGCSRVRLDTGSRQVAALTLYRSSGYIEIEDYNHQPGAEYWFEKQLAPT